MALLIWMGVEYDCWSIRRGFKMSLFFCYVMKVIEMNVFHVLFRVAWREVFRPSYNGIVNFRVFAP